LKKRSKKLLVISASVLQERLKPHSQSFLVLFFKKEPLSAACRPALGITAYLGSYLFFKKKSLP
jgi:hypothetical protein